MFAIRRAAPAHLCRIMLLLAVPMPEPISAGFMATHAIASNCAAAASHTFGLTQSCHQSPLGQAVRGHESPNRCVGRGASRNSARVSGQGFQIVHGVN